MTLRNVANNARGKLNSSIWAWTMTIVLQAWQWALFPASNFRINLKDYSAWVLISQEIAQIASRSVDTLTVTTRAVEACPRTESSTAQVSTAYSFGAYVDSLNWTIIELSVTAWAIDEVSTALDTLTTNKLDIADYLSGTKLYWESLTWTDAYAVTISWITSYSQINWQVLRIKADVANTGWATLNISALWAKTIVRYGGDPLQDNDVKAWQIMFVIWDNTQNVFELKDAIDQSSSIIARNMTDSSYYAWEAITAWQAVFIESTPALTYTTLLSEASTTPASASWGITALRWFKMLQNLPWTISSITKNGSCTATRAVIADSAWTILTSATFVWNVATFATPYFIAAWTVWRALCDASWWAYTATFGWTTQARTNVNYTLGSNPTTDDASNGWNIDSITSNTMTIASQNIGDVVANTRIAFPIFWMWVNFTTLKLALKKTISPWVDLWFRIETDSAWSPSWTPVTNGTTTFATASLMTYFVDTTITFGWNVNLTLWQMYWLVIYPWAYWSETINATNYFSIWYNSWVHTTTRPMKLRNATVYSAWPVAMTYVSSAWILDPLLSLTDATYSYKIGWRGIASSTVALWLIPNINYQWINYNQSWLVYDWYTDYFLSTTPWGITTTAPTNKALVWRAHISTALLLYTWTQTPNFISSVAYSTPLTVPAWTNVIVFEWTAQDWAGRTQKWDVVLTKYGKTTGSFQWAETNAINNVPWAALSWSGNTLTTTPTAWTTVWGTIYYYKNL